MIICFSGTPGSGKSYEAVKKILDNVALGRQIYTNIDGFDSQVCLEYQKLYLNLSDYNLSGKINYLNREQVTHFWDFVPNGSMVVIDEAHTLFSNRDWASPQNKGFSLWSTNHRHVGSDCILIAHDVEKIDKHVRSCIEWTYEFKKVGFFGSLVRNSYLWYAYFGSDVLSKPVKWGRRSYNKFIFKCYKSYFFEDVKELKIMPHANILKHPIFFILPVVLIFSLYMIFVKSSLGKGELFNTNPLKNKKIIEKTVTDRPILPKINEAAPILKNIGAALICKDIVRIETPNGIYLKTTCDEQLRYVEKLSPAAPVLTGRQENKVINSVVNKSYVKLHEFPVVLNEVLK